MGARRNDILQGTLALLVLQTLASGRKMHGYAITAHIHRIYDQLLRVEEGSLYPALHRKDRGVAGGGTERDGGGSGGAAADWEPDIPGRKDAGRGYQSASGSDAAEPPPCGAGAPEGTGVHGDGRGDTGARHRGEQRGVFGDLGRGAATAPVSARGAAGDGRAGESEGEAALRRAGAAGRLEPIEHDLPIDHR